MPGRFAVQSVGGLLSLARLASADRSTAISSDVCSLSNLHRTAGYLSARSRNPGVGRVTGPFGGVGSGCGKWVREGGQGADGLPKSVPAAAASALKMSGSR
ncbi:hypothetical protein GCM10010498_51840 [Streptomyces cavourensis]|nr:hypothetical protein GCM10010498_51840 [Streptomyces cavourensis]